jgi:hypothetical protein
MTADDLVRLILESHSLEHLKRKLEVETRKAIEEFEAAQREWNVDSLGQD